MPRDPKRDARESGGDDQQSAELDGIVEAALERGRRATGEMLHRVSQLCQASALSTALRPIEAAVRELQETIAPDLEEIDRLSAWDTPDAWVLRPCAKADASTEPNHPVRNFLECPTLCVRCCAGAVRHVYALIEAQGSGRALSGGLPIEDQCQVRGLASEGLAGAEPGKVQGLPVEIMYVDAKTTARRTYDHVREILAREIKGWGVPDSTLQAWVDHGMKVLGRAARNERVFNRDDAETRRHFWEENRGRSPTALKAGAEVARNSGAMGAMRPR